MPRRWDWSGGSSPSCSPPSTSSSPTVSSAARYSWRARSATNESEALLTTFYQQIYTLLMTTETIPIIYQDHHLLVVNKPAGLVIHPTYKHAHGTMWNAILEYFEKQGGDDWQPPELPDEPEWADVPKQVRLWLRKQRRERVWKEDGWLPK